MKVLFLFLVITTFIFARANAQYLYTDIKQRAKTLIFKENFDSNTNNWLLHDIEEELIQIENGYYLYTSRDGEPKLNTLSIPFDKSKNFEIEMSIKFVNGEDNNANGLTWGADGNKENRFRFSISGDGQYRVDKYFNQEWVNFVKWTMSPLIKKNDFNILTVRKFKTEYIFFINQEYVFSMPYDDVFGNLCGIHCNRNTTIHVDYLYVNYYKSK